MLSPRETLRVSGKQNSLFPAGPVIKCFVIPPNLKVEKLPRNRLFYANWLIDLPRFWGARPDHVRVESSCCCFPRELVSFDPRYVTRFPPIVKRIWVRRYNKTSWSNVCFTPLQWPLNPLSVFYYNFSLNKSNEAVNSLPWTKKRGF